MKDVVEALRFSETYFTEGGEEWRPISYPNFRKSPNERAWKYVSSWGRLLSDDLRVAVAKKGRGYYQTSLSIQVDGACGGTTTVALHRIVAYTFLGPPPSPAHTVDHLDRCRENNSVENLMWVNPKDQLGNREYSSYVVSVENGPTFTTVSALATYARVSTKTLSSMLRPLQVGDTFSINGVSFVVQNMTRTSMAVPTAVKPLCPKIPGEKTRNVALSLFLDQRMTVADIAEAMHIAESTVLNYLGKAAREADACTLKRLASLLGLTDPLLLQIDERLASYVVGDVEYQEFFRQVISQVHPFSEKVDWRVIRETFRSICKALKQ